ncbi:hypothetical protein SAMN04488061_0552 [Filomicrobium insigne]|uniref:Signal recognition particle n=1 Tax=Filomicrobium insigne TaxID=418854 RepID=A0A1H0HLU3_9HYPH|nr:signal recognition particle [Filomicrobium insigne]SDO20178.1 hypothetical protein SAMN04488061_0552 [Filomicrobium insigne]
MKMVLSIAGAVALMPSTAHALSDMERFEIASNLARVIAAEEACGLSYDQAAIAAYVDKMVPPDDMKFPGELAMSTSGARFELEQMSKSAKTAHCRQIERVAKSHGFTK